MPTLRDVFICQNPDCDHKIVLPHSSILRRVSNLIGPATDGDYIDLACPNCAEVFRYTQPMIRREVFDSENPNLLPWNMEWFGVWLDCDNEDCGSHVLVESEIAKSASLEKLQAFVDRWKLHGITCYSGHPAKLPLERLWDSFSETRSK